MIKIFGDKKELHAGNDSTNIQGNVVTVNQNTGLDYSQVRQVALDVFNANFYELSEVAKITAVQRAEQLVNTFLTKLELESPNLINKIQEPDVQYAVINAQKHYARSGRSETLEILTDLLKTRFQSQEGTFKSMVINEAIEVMAKLTLDQIKFITVLFLVKNCKVKNARHLIEDLSKIWSDDLETLQSATSFLEHLIFAGVATNDITTYNSQKLEYFIRTNYSDELDEKIEGKTLDVLDPPIRKQFIIDSLSQTVFDKWNNSLVNRYALTSVGKAIAVAYYNAVMNAKVDLDIWIKG